MVSYCYEIDEKGFIINSYLSDEPLAPSDCVVVQWPKPQTFYKSRWDGEQWVEGATQEEIDELIKPQPHMPTDTEILGQQMTERELEGILQGQQITDMDIRVMMLEMGAS